MLWDYGIKEIELVEEVVRKPIVYWLIKVEDNFHWVIRHQCKNAMPLIANEFKAYFGLEQAQIILCKKGGALYCLIRSYNPNLYPETTLREYSKGDNYTDDLLLQAQKIFAFRKMMGITKLDDTTIIVRKKGLVPVLLSIYETFSGKENKIPEVTFNKWFRCNDMSLTRATERLIKVNYPRALTQHEFDRFADQIQPMLDRLEYLIKFFDPDLIWIYSDVNHYLILKNSPHVKY